MTTHVTGLAVAGAGRSSRTRTRLGRRAARDAAVRLTAALAMWLGLLVVTYWWVAAGGLQDLATPASALTSLGRITGLVAADLLLVQVLLMARLPVLESAFGQDRLARLHRLVGFTSFNLMLAHIGLITWGYAAGSLADTPRTLWTLSVDYPGMLLAVAGTGCLVAVTVTSIRAARRRLRYESWHLLHLYAYLGVGLALPHQLWTGRELLTSPAATAYWWTLWAAAAGAILVFRVGLPVWRSVRHRLRVTSVVREGPGTVSVYMAGHRLDRLRVEAGQFLTWRFLSGAGASRAHPFSLSAAPDGRSLRITAKDLGDGSGSLARLRPGTPVLVEGPYGRLSDRARRGDGGVLLVGAGVGVTPLRALAEELDYPPGRATLLYRYSDVPLFADELRVLAAERGLHVLWLPGPRSPHGGWLPAAAGNLDPVHGLLSWAPDVARRDVYVCGPEDWTAAVRRTALTAGVPADQVHLESFRW